LRELAAAVITCPAADKECLGCCAGPTVHMLILKLQRASLGISSYLYQISLLMTGRVLHNFLFFVFILQDSSNPKPG